MDETYNNCRLQHRLQIIRNLKGSGSLRLDFVNCNTISQLRQSQTLSGADVEDGQIGDDLPDTAGPGQRESALRKDLRITLLVDVFLLLVSSRWFKDSCV